MNHPLSYATSIANRVVDILTPFCHRIHIAGSVRRRETYVKDIEIVCLPKTEFIKDPSDLFGGGQEFIVGDFEKAIKHIASSVVKGKVGGRYMQIILKGGITLDLFMPDQEDYYRQLVIRTGSADYVRRVVASTWKLKGWCGTPEGLRLITECVGRDGGDGKTTWKCTATNPTLPPVWDSEEVFFYWLGIPYTPPECRHLDHSLNVAQ